jgi:hypothetical protein
LVYVVVTVALYFVGQYAGDDSNSSVVGLFMFSVLAMFTLGYWAGLHRTVGQPMAQLDDVKTSTTGSTANRVVVVCSLWFLTYSLASLQQVGVTDPLSLLRAIADPRGSYYAKFEALGTEQGSTIYRVLNLMGIFYFLMVPYLLLYWRWLRRSVRFLAIASLATYLLFYLSIGTQKGVADLLIMFVACALPLRVLRRGRSATSDGSLLGRRAWLALAGVGLVGVVVIATSLGLRTDDTSSALQPPQARALYESISPVFGSVLGRGLVVLSSYLSQGYHGLALALQLPFVPAGMGAYKALSSYLPQYFGLRDPYELSYPVRVEDAFGWSATGKWSSVYPWYASDVSFAGVVLLALLFGFFLARIWRRLMRACDGLTLSVFVTCVIVVLYSPANNQLFNDRLTAIGVVTLLGLYLLRELSVRRSGLGFATP